MNINLKIIIILFLILINPINSFSNEGVIKAEKWLNDITSMTADFIQVSSDGGSAEGKIFIKKNHGFRFEYSPPSPLLIVGRGNWVIVQDLIENTSNNYPLYQTPFSRFLSDNVSLSPEGFQTTSKTKNGILELKIISNEENGGFLQLDFSTNPFQLRRWVIIDQIGTKIVVTLQNHKFDIDLPASTFRGVPIKTN
jgi:outer membrane lipoprotein-sorting protein|tara:strand:+ start:274 stop:861 length:588 start_codon:yes stop_codon:yes gene_type:complete